jgi:DNA polymerase/3'-5' exonuclease PolX
MRLLLLKVPGMGPTIAERIQRDLGNTDAAGIRRAVTTGKLQKVWGVGPKRTAAIVDALGGGEMRQEALL